MNSFHSNFRLSIPENIFIKDPQSSKLGRRILENAISLIQKQGLEGFTFKKLADHIASNESSIYRYFENKHKLLLYLISWYWGWIEYKLVFKTNNIEDKEEVLRRAIIAVTEKPKKDETFGFINEEELHFIVIQEYSKVFQTKDIDTENKNGYFEIYERLTNRLSRLIAAVKPEYEFPKTLSTNILHGSLQHHYLGQHFSELSDENSKSENFVTDFFQQLVFKTIQ
ncbi:TetR/AcrR family transcriptional regulator [Zunongwangia sp.]|uniref:TetR/AcrR family transcriptional regulator n=1 Tax=Zunongwangia sp. TaxID=1965325 RepID=UPI003AA7CB05